MANSTPKTPVGARDFNPEQAAKVYELEAQLTGCFKAANYRRVLTPAFELASVFERSLSSDDAVALMKFVDPQTGEVLALRSDITPQIARLVAGSMSSAELPLRLSYFGRVFRLRRHYDFQRREVAQAGVELIGIADANADAEVLSLCSQALVSAGADNHTLSIGHMGVLAAALGDLDDTQYDISELKILLRQKSASGVRALIASWALSVEQREFLEALCTLYGEPTEVLAQGRQFTGAIPDLQKPIDRLEAVLASVKDAQPRCVVDLGETQGFGYYTGLVFHAYLPGVGQAVASGGRYDTLIGRYGRDLPAAGFAIDEDGLTCRR